jgi:hypothetical protein
MAEVNRGKINTASKPAVDTRKCTPVQISEENCSLEKETKCIPNSMPKTQQKLRKAKGDTALRKRNANNDQL